MDCPINTPVEKELSYQGRKENSYRIIDALKRTISKGLTEQNAEYIVQAINNLEELKNTARCPCGGKLEGLGYKKLFKKIENVVFECNRCGAQLLLENSLWQKILKEKP